MSPYCLVSKKGYTEEQALKELNKYFEDNKEELKHLSKEHLAAAYSYAYDFWFCPRGPEHWGDDVLSLNE